MTSYVINKQQEDLQIRKNMGLVRLLAKSFNPPNLDEYDEYVQLGSLGLLKAIRHHDPKRGKLSTLAWRCIVNEISGYVKKVPHFHHLCEETTYVVAPETVQDVLPDSLTKLEREVITLRSGGGYTFKEIGLELGYTRGWANKVFKTAVAKIRKANHD